MLLGCLFGNQQHEQKINRATIWRIEWNRRRQAQKCADRLLESLDAAMGNGNPLTEARGAEFFASKQAVENDCPGKPQAILEQHACLFKDSLLTSGIEVEHDLID